MMTAELPKKTYCVPWYRLKNPLAAFCPDCQVPMIANGTKELEDGLTIQYRRCPRCQKTAQTTYRR